MPKCKAFPHSTPFAEGDTQRGRERWEQANRARFHLVFCDYCDVYLTHDSMSVRKAHNSGRNHLRNVVDYYQRKCGRLL